jgi:choline dehydrogenase-like flavoprotein
MPKDRAQLIYSYATTPFLQPSPNVSIIAGYVVLLQPEASGYVTLNTSDYRDAPLVHSKFWSTPGDKAAIMYGYKQLRKIMHSRSLSPLLHEELYPGEGATIDEDIWRAIKQSSQSWHHALGTVALGTVLDRNWRVKGLKGIRVVGSPAIPRPPTCAIQAHVYAVAHRAALDIIEADGLDGCRGRGNCD